MSADTSRRLRITALAALATLLALAILLALPPVQLRLVRLIANSVDGIELELGYLRAGPRGVELNDLRVEVAAAGLAIAVVTALAAAVLPLREIMTVPPLQGLRNTPGQRRRRHRPLRRR